MLLFPDEKKKNTRKNLDFFYTKHIAEQPTGLENLLRQNMILLLQFLVRMCNLKI